MMGIAYGRPLWRRGLIALSVAGLLAYGGWSYINGWVRAAFGISDYYTATRTLEVLLPAGDGARFVDDFQAFGRSRGFSTSLHHILIDTFPEDVVTLQRSDVLLQGASSAGNRDRFELNFFSSRSHPIDPASLDGLVADVTAAAKLIPGASVTSDVE